MTYHGLALRLTLNLYAPYSKCLKNFDYCPLRRNMSTVNDIMTFLDEDKHLKLPIT